jgi:peptidoglycan/LPS O-acetylase OafA/YrhL
MTAACTPSDTRAAAYILELDGLRGMAALMVVFYHAFYWSMGENWSAFPKLVASVTQVGWTGVDLFFVLSGFLITGVLLRAKGRPKFLRLFYVRRALRILPVYYGFLLILEILSPTRNTGFVLVSLIYLSNASLLFGIPMIYGPLWSLSVEEHFYLLWPWVVSAARISLLAVIAGAVVVVEPLLRLRGFKTGADTFILSWFRFDGLALGALIALFSHSRFYSRWRLTAAAAASLLSGIALVSVFAPLGILTRTRPLGASMQATCCGLLYCGCVALVVAWSGTGVTAWLRLRTLRYCGDISYCLYVIHLLVFFSWDGFMRRAGIPLWPGRRFDVICLRAMACTGISLGIAALSRRFWELPFLRLKERFE